MNKNYIKKSMGYAVIIVIAIGVLLFLFSISIVKSGTVGVVSKMGVIQDEIFLPGLNLKIPFITSVRKVNIQTQKVEAFSSAASKDLQTVSADIAVNYKVNPNSAVTLYKEVGKTYETTIIAPAIQESIKAITAQYSAEQLITNRQ